MFRNIRLSVFALAVNCLCGHFVLAQSTAAIGPVKSPSLTQTGPGMCLVSESPFPAAQNLPAGICTSSVDSYFNLTGRIAGPGYMRTTESGVLRYQSNDISNITKAPVYTGNEDGINTAFDGDFSNVHEGFQTWISGTTTLGTPATGYRYSPVTTGIYGYVANNSGWNQATDSNDGRTGATAVRVNVFQAGQGDLVAYNASGFVTGEREGATTFLANPAVALFNGQVTAGSNGVYLNPLELLLTDAGHDVAGIGNVVNLDRTNATGALGATWMGYRAQSIGATSAGVPVAIDAFFSVAGASKIGLDLTGGNYGSGSAAIAIKPGDRIYLCATNSSATKFSSETNVCKSWITSTASGATQVVVNNVLALEIGGEGHIMMPNLPTSSSGLTAGSLWNNKGTLSIVP
jgi:hypothetical protein